MPKFIRSRFLWWPIAAALPLFLTPLCESLALAPSGSRIFLAIESGLVMGCMGVPIGLAVGIGMSLRGPSRWEGTLILVCSLVYCTAELTGFVLGQSIRRNQMIAFTQRSQPLVAAIRRYEKKYSAVPKSLSVMVPEFLPTVPETGLGAYPHYRYELPKRPGEYDGNDWALIVDTDLGMNFDSMMYLPRQNYPKHGYGGALERINDWAYVHE